MESLKIYLKNIIKLLIMNLTRILFVFPISQKRIFFSSYMGENITCNPKCIFDYLRNEYHNKLEYIWAYNGGQKGVYFDEKVKIVKEFSIKWFYYRATSRVIVDNCNPTFNVPRRSGQLIVQTWHAGGAYKKVGCAASNVKFEKWILQKTMSVTNLFISSSEIFTQKNIEEGYHYKGDILNSGMPRNDIFFDPQQVKDASEKVKKYFGINGVIVLYAPTFRGNLHNPDKIIDTIDIDQVRSKFEKRYEEEATILVRCHHWDKNEYSFKDKVLDATKYPDMQELLCASDVLITDYSSCMWDYAFLGRPCFLYVPDIYKYTQNRGFFTDVKEWPGILCEDNEKLFKAIETFDELKSSIKAENYLHMMNSYETGHATQKVSEKIINYINK